MVARGVPATYGPSALLHRAMWTGLSTCVRANCGPRGRVLWGHVAVASVWPARRTDGADQAGWRPRRARTSMTTTDTSVTSVSGMTNQIIACANGSRIG